MMVIACDDVITFTSHAITFFCISIADDSVIAFLCIRIADDRVIAFLRIRIACDDM